MATITRNEEKNGIEISFPEKPDSVILGWLKANGFRWSQRAKVWYKKYTDQDFETVNNYFK